MYIKPASPQAIGNRKNSKDAPLLRDLIKDTLPLIEEEKKAWRQVDTNLGPLDYETIDLTTSPPPLPKLITSVYVEQMCNLQLSTSRALLI